MAVHLDEVVGFAVTLDTVGEQEILNLAVAQASRRTGVGTLLVSAVGRRTDAIHLEVRERNEPAVRFYKRLGFTVESRRTAYYSNPPDNALVMTLSP